MAQKENPSCKIPDIKLPPDLEKFIANLSAKVAADKLIPSVAKEAARKLAAAQKKLDVQKRAAARIDAAKKKIERYSKINCPLPKVPHRSTG